MPTPEQPDDSHPTAHASSDDDLIFLKGDGGDAPNFDIDDDGPHALPVVLDLDDDLGALIGGPLRKPIDLDADSPGAGETDEDEDADGFQLHGAGGLDLSALIGEYDATHRRGQKSRPSAEPSPQRESDLSSEVVRLKTEIEDLRNQVRRGQADLINQRRKGEASRERAVRDSEERLIKQILPIVDDFERGLALTADTRSYEQLAEGVEAILRNFDAFLTKQGVEVVETTGVFDPDIHEAVGVDEASDLPDDTIVAELRRGYRSEGRLLRAAMVRVARRASPNATETAADQPSPE